MAIGRDMRSMGAGSQADWARHMQGKITVVEDGEIVTDVTGTLTSGTIKLKVQDGQVVGAVAS